VLSTTTARLKNAAERSNNRWVKWLLAAIRVGAKFAGLFMREVERCVDRTRIEHSLDASWSITYAADDGKDVYIRFDREPETRNWQMLAVRVDKATEKITVISKIASHPSVKAG
jgi:hypothetical protein